MPGSGADKPAAWVAAVAESAPARDRHPIVPLITGKDTLHRAAAVEPCLGIGQDAEAQATKLQVAQGTGNSQMVQAFGDIEDKHAVELTRSLGSEGQAQI